MRTNARIRGVPAGVAILLLLGSIATASENQPVSEKPLFFRILVTVEPAKEIRGYLDESKGTGKGYDVAVCDLDGDGVPETRNSSGLTIDYGGGRVEELMQPTLELEHAGYTWSVTFEPHWGGVRRGSGESTEVDFSWDVVKGDWFVTFINGSVRTYPTAAAALKAEPNRVGPPFRWVIESRTRGPTAVVAAGLDDQNDARMRIGMRGEEYIRARLKIIAKDGTTEETLGDYG